MALIEYIGKQVNRRDDVLQTSRRWNKAGDVVELPDAEKHFYLAHPGEWRETTAELMKVREDARNVADHSLATLRGAWDSLLLPDLYQARQELDDEIRRREAADVAENDARMAVLASRKREETVAIEVGLSDTQIPDPNSEAGQVRQEQIKRAISELDRKDPEHFTKAGLPRVGAVREAVGFDVTAEEIQLAYDPE